MTDPLPIPLNDGRTMPQLGLGRAVAARIAALDDAAGCIGPDPESFG